MKKINFFKPYCLICTYVCVIIAVVCITQYFKLFSVYPGISEPPPPKMIKNITYVKLKNL